jgi:hypothetical protein
MADRNWGDVGVSIEEIDNEYVITFGDSWTRVSGLHDVAIWGAFIIAVGGALMLYWYLQSSEFAATLIFLAGLIVAIAVYYAWNTLTTGALFIDRDEMTISRVNPKSGKRSANRSIPMGDLIRS